MGHLTIFGQLLKVLEQNQVIIRIEAMGGAGGGGQVADKTVFLLDKDIPVSDNRVLAATVGRAFRTFKPSFKARAYVNLLTNTPK
jgi:hypothetical protein